MIYVTGDIHGSMLPIYNLCNTLNPTSDDVVVILGDVAAFSYIFLFEEHIL